MLVTPRASRAGFIVSPLVDAVLVIGSPLLALGVTTGAWLALGRPRSGIDGTWVSLALGMLIGGHVLVTLVHTHGNAAVFARHPWRFTAVPLLLVAALFAVPGLRIAALVVGVFWDVHHGSMQTFGFARLYARRAGNLTGAGRTLDLVLCYALYAGPLVAGAGLLIESRALGAAWPAMLPRLTLLAERVQPCLGPMRVALVILGMTVLGAHVIGHVRMARRGVPVSPQAILLLAGTGITSVVSWGLNPFAMALFTMKLFHCVQYFALVAQSERRQIAGWLGRTGRATPFLLVVATLLLPALAYGLWARVQVNVLQEPLALSVILTLALMHYWFDGFTWSASSEPGAPSP